VFAVCVCEREGVLGARAWCAIKCFWHVMGGGCGIAAQASGATPVYVASLNGHVEVLRALLVAGAAVNQAAVSVYHSVWENVGAGCVLCEVTEV
jgi:hypothetical protein